MWKLLTIKANNLCAFQNLNYTLLQGFTTLVFGNNMDNDSQGSNGSGKSAMIEAVAIGLTGETLRKVQMEEIINDAANEATVELLLLNDTTNEHFQISRTISRKAPQVIVLHKYMSPEDADKDSSVVVQPTVADYNAYILDTIGLSKADIFANFILSKHKYTSFLSASDKDKKEIINRCSNGVIVDDSIAALQADIVPVQSKLQETETQIAVLTGKIETLAEQIEQAKTAQANKSEQKKERIKQWHDAITAKRQIIRDQNAEKYALESSLPVYNDIDEHLQSLESGDKDTVGCYKVIVSLYTKNNIAKPKDYAEMVAQYQAKVKELGTAHKELAKQIAVATKQVAAAEQKHNKSCVKLEKFNVDYDKSCVKLDEQVKRNEAEVQKLRANHSDLLARESKMHIEIANLQKKLAGVIECPACHHEFLLNENVDVNVTRNQLADRQGELGDIAEDIQNTKDKMSQLNTAIANIRDKQTALASDRAVVAKLVSDAEIELAEANNTERKLQHNIADIDAHLQNYNDAINHLRKSLFDEAFDILDSCMAEAEGKIKQCDMVITQSQAAIQSYEESIRDIENTLETDMTETMKARQAEYEGELEAVKQQKDQVAAQLAELNSQVATFTEFKTYLANTKIDALSQATNDFLEAIGSDIRIVFSGYTLLKSGKIRDKISISLIRNGVDCGSFAKFSEGEKARVNLANILAMRRLTNSACANTKGLDLLILDEILEAADEQGLANIFNALNQLHLTSLVVSHGNIAENYPYRTVVCKQNGISYINENNN